MTDLKKIAKEYVSWKARPTLEQQQNYRRAKQIAELNKKRGKKKKESTKSER